MKSTWILLALLLANSVPAFAETLSLQRQQELLYMLRHDCGSCHGMLLHGGLGPALLPENLQGKAPDGLGATIFYGRPGTAMPPWRALLTWTEINWLVSQLRQGRLNQRQLAINPKN
ncbi:c-type cytochrome [Candidatus Venteria ishoeyi]|uniref:Cytochrome c domain-containing protein n=1 Tax=Candidatus Venteria ishoeyi TaxID=1899563 RepID=A0A1H6FFN8_9GAMM|nr:cytochrome c [Candidatus Venteria ishoeyi]MDM8546120.1 cytochrome c [Candidatus Venteria ishoeyi]SEH07986.1 Uncharacterised protein [Candidatus Venteria ishoeyi]